MADTSEPITPNQLTPTGGNLRSAAEAARLEGGHSYPDLMDLEFSGQIWFWKGPAPWYFVTVPEEESDNLEATATSVSYGWGMIPVTAQIGETEWETSLWPKDERYIVPLKADVRKAEGLKEGDTVTVRLAVSI